MTATMHPYSNSRCSSQTVYYILLFVAVLFFTAIDAGITRLANELARVLPATWFADVKGAANLLLGNASALGISYLFFKAFDKYALKCQWFRKWLLLPDLNGTWEVSACTVYKNGVVVNNPWSARVKISQSWTRILIKLERDGSSGSVSTSASLKYIEGDGYQLVYNYENKPDMRKHDLKPHQGVVYLHLDEDSAVMKGHYFTSHERTTAGEMRLTRVKR